jgi:adenylate cyclase
VPTPLTKIANECAVMFADIAGSTALYETYGDLQAQFIVSQCLTKMSNICAQHSGVLIKTVGDEIMCRFPGPDDAVRAAQRINQTLENDSASSKIKLSVRIGLHYGQVIERDADVYGDAVNLAARLTSIARAKQIITTEATVKELSPEMVPLTRLFDKATVKGKQKEIKMYEVLWGQEDVTTIISTAVMKKHVVTASLILKYHNIERTLLPATQPLLIGRGPQCGIVVESSLISRVHARFEYRRGKFVLVDQSTNGTFIKSQNGREVYIRREELPLWGQGTISLGQSINSDKEHLIYFKCN